jgi:hypothetical protein
MTPASKQNTKNVLLLSMLSSTTVNPQPSPFSTSPPQTPRQESFFYCCSPRTTTVAPPTTAALVELVQPERRPHHVALQVPFERQTLKPVFHLIGYRLWV